LIWRVPLADLDYGQEEEIAVLNVLRSRWLTMGKITRKFEVEFAHFLGIKHAIAVTNATEALHLACLAIGLKPGDEVLVPSLSFVATSNAVLYTGADVRFIDIIGADELTIDPDDLSRQIGPNTKAIIVMHYGGYPCHMKEIQSLADANNLPVIEDAAHASGASLDGKALGTWGKIGCFSFYSNKNISTGEGGMLVTDYDEIAEKVRLLRSHAMTNSTYDRHLGQANNYDVVDLGYNYRIDEIHSALGLEQLKKLTRNNALRKTWTEKYWQAFKNTDMGLPFYSHNGSPSYHIFPVILPERINRESFLDALKAEGIQTSLHYPPIHRFHYYQSRYGEISLGRTENVAEHEVTLPLYPGMGEEKVSLVIDTVLRTISTNSM
jgi:dTDP-4-amino-4,6-dideoxygalactose transaminase